MADDTRRDYSEDQRRLQTPNRSRSRSHSALRRRDRCRHCEREIELEQAVALLALEREVHRERENRSRGCKSRSRDRDAASKDRNCGRPRSKRSRPASPLQRERSWSTASSAKRSCGRCDQPRPECREHCENYTTSHKRSRITFSIKDVMDIVNSIKINTITPPSTSGTSKNIGHTNILPEFDPSVKTQRVDIWLHKVNECASVYGWDEKTTTHFAMQKLQGLAKVWYEGLNTISYSWTEWQEKLTSAFPCEQNYGQLLEAMLKRKSKFGEPIEKYYYEKLTLLNQCDITGKSAVDCIIHGITDITMKSSALALCCSQPDQLLKFLINNKEAPLSERNHGIHKKWVGTSCRINRSQSHVVCFNCKESGHPFMLCPKQMVKCNKFGHRAENCHVTPENSESTGSPSKTMCIISSCSNLKFIKGVKVNNLQTEAFIDFGTEVTLVKQSLVSNIGLVHDQVPSVIKGFRNGTVQSLGTLLLDVEVNGVSARVACRVVSDELLDKPILLGQSFTEQRHTLVYKDFQTL